MNKKEFKTWLKAQQDYYGKEPVILESEWLTFAQKLQRNIYDTFRVTACEVTMRYSNIFNERVIDIEVWQYEKPVKTDKDKVLYGAVTLRRVTNGLYYDAKKERAIVNKFINYLIENL